MTTHHKLINLEFKSGQTNYFDINTRKFGTNTHCVAKASGNKDLDYFVIKFRFTINSSIKQITNFKIDKIKHTDSNGNLILNNKEDKSNSSSVEKDEFEQLVSDNIKLMLTTCNIKIYGCYSRVSIKLPVNIDNSDFKIVIGSKKYIGKELSSSKTKSSFDSTTSYTDNSSSTKCSSFIQKIMKLISWSVVVSFVIYILKYNFITDKNIVGNEINEEINNEINEEINEEINNEINEEINEENKIDNIIQNDNFEFHEPDYQMVKEEDINNIVNETIDNINNAVEENINEPINESINKSINELTNQVDEKINIEQNEN